jgi:site-specific DNA recombinase
MISEIRSNPMSPTHSLKKGIRYRYYVSTAVVQGRKAEAGSVARIPASEVETIVLDAMREQFGGAGQGNEDFKALNLRVSVCLDLLKMIWVEQNKDPGADGVTHRLVIPYAFNPHKKKREIILPSASHEHVQPIRRSEQQNLVRSIAQGRAWLASLLTGSESVSSISIREQKSERMIRMVLSLAFLDPKLVRAALHGRLPRGISARRLIDSPMAWSDQWPAIGLSRPI